MIALTEIQTRFSPELKGAIIAISILTINPAYSSVLCPPPMVEVFNNGKGPLGKDDCLTRAQVETERGKFSKTKAKTDRARKLTREE